MMRFQFRFASILQLRRREQDEVRRDIATCLAAIESMDEQIDANQLDHAELIRSPNLRRVGRISLETLQFTQRQAAFLRSQRTQLHQQRAELEAQLTDHQDRLIAAQIEVKRYETLEASDAQQHCQVQQRIANRHAG